jgi:hypothetical protein
MCGGSSLATRASASMSWSHADASKQFIGHVQNALQLRMMMFVPRASHLTIIQRVAVVSEHLTTLMSIGSILVYFSVPFALLSGFPFVVFNDNAQLIWLLRLASTMQITTELQKWSLTSLIDLRDHQTVTQIEGWLQPCSSQYNQCMPRISEG